MIRRRFGLLACALVLAMQLSAEPDVADAAASAPRSAPSAPTDADLMAKGAYIARAADCEGCHTMSVGGAPFGGGLPMQLPIGKIFSTNISPDPNFGIGRYSLEEFDNAVRRGIAPGGKNLYPAMPYTAFARMNSADLRALYAYMMKGVAPVQTVPQPTRLPFPFNQRWALRGWNLLFARQREFVPRTDRDFGWNRGAYLVQALGHCGACHTPRGLFNQEKAEKESSEAFLTGQVNDYWFASNLTTAKASGLDQFAEADIALFLKTGHAKGLAAFGSMVQVVENSLQHLTDDDLTAIAIYLKSLPPQRQFGGVKVANEGIGFHTSSSRKDVEEDGARTYRAFCAECHGTDGSGLPSAHYPRLVNNPALLGADATSVIRIVMEGGRSAQTKTGPPISFMPAFRDRLSDVQIAQVVSHIRSAWGNRAPPVSASHVRQLGQDLTN